MSKRVKRDAVTRAEKRGFQAGIQGTSKDKCPHEKGTASAAWHSGWREGRAKFWEGYDHLE